MMDVRATPFHARTAVLNPGNAWTSRNGFTLATAYGDRDAEALAARTTAAMADISWRWRLRLEGERAGEFLSRLCTKNVAALSPGVALKALWLSDGGGVRGAGAVARLGPAAFTLYASAPDREWIGSAAARVGVAVRDVSDEDGGIALIGPYAAQILKAAGLDPALEPLSFRRMSWRGLDILLSRFGEHGGYELWCQAEEATVVWDRMMRAGVPFALQPAGLAAMDVLDLEKGIVRPVRDYEPARTGFAAGPTPASLGLERLIDAGHMPFNGRAAWLAARERETQRLIGLALESQDDLPNAILLAGGQAAGHTLACGFSPALRRTVALAQVHAGFAEPGTEFTLVSPAGPVPGRGTELPFLPDSGQIPP